jgi:hypothetical protein
MESWSTEVARTSPSHRPIGARGSGRSHARRIASRTNSATLLPERFATRCNARSSSARKYTCVFTIIGVSMMFLVTHVNARVRGQQRPRCGMFRAVARRCTSANAPNDPAGVRDRARRRAAPAGRARARRRPRPSLTTDSLLVLLVAEQHADTQVDRLERLCADGVP